jgi:murein endopeptidase
MMTHTVVAGDTLGKIARSYDTSVDDVRLRNRLKGNLIRPGQVLAVAPGTSGRGRPLLGQSVGKAYNGKLVNPSLLPRSRAYFRRRPQRAWGANYVVHQVRKAAELVRRRHPKVHRLSIGDISDRDGGQISEHRSHQSGRDVDVGFYFKRKPKTYPEHFVRATKATLNFDATWLLLKTFAASAESPHGVERIYMSYETQKMIYDLAAAKGVSKKLLGKLFQYPNGGGLIRHEPGHDAHFHVRFKCPKGDKSCY